MAKAPPKDPGKGKKFPTSGLKNWVNRTGKSFRQLIKGKVEFPPQRPADIFK